MGDWRNVLHEHSPAQVRVTTFLNSPPPVMGGERYIVGTTPSGPFAGRPNAIATFTGTEWLFDTPEPGWRTYVSALEEEYVFHLGRWQPSILIESKGDLIIGGNSGIPERLPGNSTVGTRKFLSQYQDDPQASLLTTWEQIQYSDIASTPDLSGFVPYTGATANVNLNSKNLAGVNNLTVANIINGQFHDSYRTNGDFTNKIIGERRGDIAQSPMGKYLWHDMTPFDEANVSFETSTNGTDWVAGTLDRIFFNQKEDQTQQVINPAIHKAVRWTWTNRIQYSNIVWVVLGHTWNSGTASNKTILIESWNGSVWTQRHTSTYSTTMQAVWHWIPSLGADTQLRVTIIHNSGDAVNLSSIRLMSPRWGDQGRGSEYTYPYNWNKDKDMNIKRLGIGRFPSYELDVAGNGRFDGVLRVIGLAGNGVRNIGVNENGELIELAMSGTPAGNDNEIQYNLSNDFSSSSNFAYDPDTYMLSVLSDSQNRTAKLKLANTDIHANIGSYSDGYYVAEELHLGESYYGAYIESGIEQKTGVGIFSRLSFNLKVYGLGIGYERWNMLVLDGYDGIVKIPGGVIQLGSSVLLTGNFLNTNFHIPSSSGYYFGESGSNGSWRSLISSSNMVFSTRESGSWNPYFTISRDGIKTANSNGFFKLNQVASGNIGATPAHKLIITYEGDQYEITAKKL